MAAPTQNPLSRLKMYSSPKPNNTPRGDGNRDKGKALIKEFPEQRDGKRCFKCQVMATPKLTTQPGGPNP